MVWALVKDGSVQNLIIADQRYIDYIKGELDHCICIDKLDDKPTIGTAYDGTKFIITKPAPIVVEPVEEPSGDE